MKFRYLLILLMNISLAYGQETHLFGYVRDAQTGLPVGEATISIPTKNLFYPTSSEGAFNIKDDKISGTDSLAISCIGYQTFRITAEDMPPNDTVKLVTLVKVLREVKIGLFQCGSRVKSQNMWAAYNPLNEHAMFMFGSKNIQGSIQSIGFYLGNASNGDALAPFRVRIYGVNDDGTPGKELTENLIITSAKKNNAWFDVDISAYDIQNPPNGFFVAFCLIDAEHYQASNGAKLLTPRLGMTESEFKSSLSFRGQYKYKKIEWHQEPFDYNYMIRASIVPE
ncbi:MAG: hypothetical protein ACHQHN_17320 [Sphingobacteriales bacterium]